MRFVIGLIAVLVLVLSDQLSAAGVVSSGRETWLAPELFIVAVGAALSTGALTLADWAKRLDPEGKVPRIVEMLAQRNEVLLDMKWNEGNLPTGHRTTIRTGLPSVAWRLLNQGVAPSKSTTAQIDEQCGMLEAWTEVDKDLAAMNGNLGEFRLSESRPFIEAMNQEMASTLFYGNGGIAPEEFTGLSVRYSLSTAANGSNLLLAGGQGGDNTSLWLLAWDTETLCGIFPKGSKAGLIHDDYGEETVEMTAGIAGSRMRAYRERWQWKAGIALKDWRYAVRICNIDISELSGQTPADLLGLMGDAVEIIPDELGTRVFYCNRTIRRFLRRQALASVTAGGGLTYENFSGKRVLMYDDVPIRRTDALLNNETLVA